MRRLLVFLFFQCSFGLAQAQTKITTNITGLQNENGVCRACLFTSASSFSGEGKPYQCLVTKVENRSAQLIFENIKPGEYAVLVFHDANNNHKMDKNFLGIPREGYGASMNKLPFASAPSFRENKFYAALNTTTHLSIKLRNL